MTESAEEKSEDWLSQARTLRSQNLWHALLRLPVPHSAESDPEVCLLLAEALLKDQQDASRDAALRALSLLPSPLRTPALHPRALLLSGLARLALDQWDAAESALSEARSLLPPESPAGNEAAKALEETASRTVLPLFRHPFAARAAEFWEAAAAGEDPSTLLVRIFGDQGFPAWAESDARSIAFSSFGVRETAILLDALIKLAPDDAERDLTLTLGIPASAAPVRLPSGGLLPVRDALFRVNGFSDDSCASVSIHSEALSVIQDPAERAAAAFMTAARAIGEIRAMRCLTAFPAITSDEEDGRFLSAEAFAAALRTRFSEKDWEKLSDPDQLLESETRYRVPDSARNEPLFSGLEEGATRLPGFFRAFIQGSADDTPFLAAGAVCGAFLISGEVTGNEKTCRKLLRDLGNETVFFVPLGFLYGRAGIRLDFLALAPDVFDIAEAYFSRHFRRGSVRFSRFRHRTSASSRSEPSQLPVEIYRQL